MICKNCGDNFDEANVACPRCGTIVSKPKTIEFKICGNSLTARQWLVCDKILSTSELDFPAHVDMYDLKQSFGAYKLQLVEDIKELKSLGLIVEAEAPTRYLLTDAAAEDLRQQLGKSAVNHR